VPNLYRANFDNRTVDARPRDGHPSGDRAGRYADRRAGHRVDRQHLRSPWALVTGAASGIAAALIALRYLYKHRGLRIRTGHGRFGFTPNSADATGCQASST
jgi:hypothetical protein